MERIEVFTRKTFLNDDKIHILGKLVNGYQEIKLTVFKKKINGAPSIAYKQFKKSIDNNNLARLKKIAVVVEFSTDWENTKRATIRMFQKISYLNDVEYEKKLKYSKEWKEKNKGDINEGN